MLRQQARSVAATLYAVDLLATLAALLAAYFLRGTLLPVLLPKVFPAGLHPLSLYLVLAGPIVLIWSAFLFATGSFRSRRTSGLKTEMAHVARVSLGGTVALILVVYLARWDFISRPFLFLFGIVGIVFLALERLAVRLIARKVRIRGFNFRTVVLVGDTPRARALARRIREHAWWGLRILCIVRENDDGGAVPDAVEGIPVLGSLADFPAILTANPVDEVILTVDRGQLEKFEDVFLRCEEMGVRTRLVLDFFPHVLARVELEEFEGTPLLTFSTTPDDGLALTAKRTLDVSLSILLGLVYLVPVLLAAILVRLSSRGPALFRQTRCGLNGRPFTLFKLRTMVDGADDRLTEVKDLNQHDGPVFKARHDPRVTPLGRLIRRLSLDEAPQFWNVLKGEMSLVGPRPPLPGEVSRYELWQRRRLSMKPGVTGLWQVSGRSEILDFEQWMELDLAYIDNWSIGLDLKILLRTVPAVLSGRGAR